MNGPRITSVRRGDWDAARTALAGLDRLPTREQAAGADAPDTLARLNAATGKILPKIAASSVRSGAAADSDKYFFNFHVPTFFYPGPSGYDAVFSLQPQDAGLPMTFVRPVSVQISASTLIYELDGPAMMQTNAAAAHSAAKPSTKASMGVSANTSRSSSPSLARRASLKAVAGAFAGLMLPTAANAEDMAFDQWITAFRAKAIAHGITPETYAQVMNGLKPDTTGLEAIRNQPEFNLQLWQYLNRATSDWKISAGKEKAKLYAPLLARIEQDFGVEHAFVLGVWGIESAFSDPVVEKNHMRPVIPSLATLAFAERRRRAYWKQELINALMIIQHGWSAPEEMVARGPAPWAPPNGCPRSGSMSPSITTATARSRPTGRPTTRWPRQHAILSNAAISGAANIGVTR